MLRIAGVEYRLQELHEHHLGVDHDDMDLCHMHCQLSDGVHLQVLGMWHTGAMWYQYEFVAGVDLGAPHRVDHCLCRDVWCLGRLCDSGGRTTRRARHEPRERKTGKHRALRRVLHLRSRARALRRGIALRSVGSR